MEFLANITIQMIPGGDLRTVKDKSMNRNKVDISYEDLDRFWERVDGGDDFDEGPCWEWKSYIGPTGYCLFGFNGKNIGAHRLAFEIFFGKLLPGENVMHACGNKLCVNPHHLKVGAKNQFRKSIKYRKKRMHFVEIQD